MNHIRFMWQCRQHVKNCNRFVTFAFQHFLISITAFLICIYWACTLWMYAAIRCCLNSKRSLLPSIVKQSYLLHGNPRLHCADRIYKHCKVAWQLWFSLLYKSLRKAPAFIRLNSAKSYINVLFFLNFRAIFKGYTASTIIYFCFFDTGPLIQIDVNYPCRLSTKSLLSSC